jgi:hypothetical protein
MISNPRPVSRSPSALHCVGRKSWENSAFWVRDVASSVFRLPITAASDSRRYSCPTQDEPEGVRAGKLKTGDQRAGAEKLSLVEIEAFLGASARVRFVGCGRTEIYGWVERLLCHHEYPARQGASAGLH